MQELEAISKAIQKCQDLKEFNLKLFTKVIETIMNCIAQKLWNLVVLKANLIQHLSGLKDYFLLAKGEFYMFFIEEARQLFSMPPSSRADYEINNGPALRAATRLGIEDDNQQVIKKFKMRSFKFHYNDFKYLDNLICTGSVQKHKQKILRIGATKKSRKSGAIWHQFK